MNNKIIIIGAFHEIIELAEDNEIVIVGLVDTTKNDNYRGYKIIGTDKEAINFDRNYPLLITPDSPYIRSKLAEYYNNLGFSFTILISSSAKVSKSAIIKEGSIVQFGVNISSECTIGKFVKLNTYCNIMHNSCIGDYTTIAPNAVILGNVKIGNNCYIGSNATVLPNVKIGNDSVVGAGSVVTKDVPAFSIVAGNPTKILKQFKDSEEIENYFRSKQKLK